MLMLIGLCSCPFWYLLSLRVGKVRAWQVASFVQCSLFLSLGFTVGQGLVARTIAFCGFIGIGTGSWFLNDSILADIIDYHEFITVNFIIEFPILGLFYSL